MQLASKILTLFICIFLLGCGSEEQANSDVNNIPQKDLIAESQNQNNAHVDRSWPIRYGIQKGHISYKYSGIQRGTEEVYFDDYGMLEIKFTETVRDNPFQGTEEKISLITLMRDSSIYVVDQSTMNARKIDNTLLHETALESASLDLGEVAENMYLDRGGFIEKKEIIAGVETNLWYIESAKTRDWKYKGIMMKTRVEMPRNFVEVEATAIDTVSSLPEGIFDLPKNVNIQDGISMKTWIEELSKPIERRQVFDVRNQNKK